MDALHLAHLIVLCAWGGLVLAEVIVEALGTLDPAGGFACRAHFWIDALIELPLIGGVLVTGGLLCARIWPLTPLHWVKVGAALLAICCNLYCALLVWQRYRHRAEPTLAAALARRIRFTGVGIAPGLVAMILGLRYFA